MEGTPQTPATAKLPVLPPASGARLQQIAGLTQEEARTRLMTKVEKDVQAEVGMMIRRHQERAKETGIAGTAEHLALRQSTSRKVMADFKAWLDAEKPKHLPKGPMGAAIGYALNQWETLTQFLDDARVPLDNNKAERALRAAALGKKNWLFVGNDQAGENLAGLYSLVATCQANGVNPAAYLTDVLVRLGTHPVERLDELLPQNWTPLTLTPPT